ncbi:hypothetical protein [Fibrobacter succinogenes]|uniref:hypothetical protein n=1 Tax=Fibrobacter succinogenes TaxID=833 RepID=UPI0015667E8D|nr:hypothetical protein [Fibrobacter succinogenes]
MSELKDYSILDIEAIDDERLAKSELGKIQETRVYIKSEADKVIAELKSDIADLRDDKKLTDAILDERNAEIAELKGEIEKLNRMHRLRNASEELPMDNDNVYVILENGFETTDRYDHDKGHWHYHWYTVKYWMPTPSAPEEKKL